MPRRWAVWVASGHAPSRESWASDPRSSVTTSTRSSMDRWSCRGGERTPLVAENSERMANLRREQGGVPRTCRRQPASSKTRGGGGGSHNAGICSSYFMLFH